MLYIACIIKVDEFLTLFCMAYFDVQGVLYFKPFFE